MKAVVNIEFIISITIFLGTITFVMMMFFNTIIPGFHQKTSQEILRTKTYHLSEYLMFDKLADTETDTERYYILDAHKIDKFDIRCRNDYDSVKKELFGDQNINFAVKITDLEGNIYCNCHPHVESEYKTKSSISRIAVVDNKIVKANIEVLA